MHSMKLIDDDVGGSGGVCSTHCVPKIDQTDVRLSKPSNCLQVIETPFSG